MAGTDVDAARRELEAYYRENAEHVPPEEAMVAVYGGALEAVLAYACVLIVLACLSMRWTLGIDWITAGEMQAGRFIGGEWWRSVTALTLHADVGHLSSNLVYGGVFGFLAGRVLGGGVAWLAIVLAGTVGNGLNALIRDAGHLSIGASTGVFAALGLLVAHALHPTTRRTERLLKRWSPLIAGCVLLAFTGVGGPRTDVAAHVFGFVAGVVWGAVGCRVPQRWLARQGVQLAAGGGALLLVAVAWAAAIGTVALAAAE